VNYWLGSFVEAVMQDAPAIPGSNLPEDPALLQAMIRELLATNQQLQRRGDQLERRLAQLLKRLYGPRADKLNPDQASLFDEPPPEPLPPLPEPTVEAPVRQPKPGHGRRSLPTNLRRERGGHDIPGRSWPWRHWVRSARGQRKLDYAVEPVRAAAAAAEVCGSLRISRMLHIAGLPPALRVESAFGLVADIVSTDRSPALYRQKKHFPPGSNCPADALRLAGRSAEVACFTRSEGVLSAKAATRTTRGPVRILPNIATGRIWDYVSEYGWSTTPPRTTAATGRRSSSTDSGLFAMRRVRQADDLAQSRGTVACWAHARRKFVEAEKTSPQLAHEAVARIKALYAIEHEAKGLDAVARAALRQQKAKPLLDAMKEWLDREQRTALPKTPIAEAITYALNQCGPQRLRARRESFDRQQRGRAGREALRHRPKKLDVFWIGPRRSHTGNPGQLHRHL
jgi:hypothetical protein